MTIPTVADAVEYVRRNPGCSLTEAAVAIGHPGNPGYLRRHLSRLGPPDRGTRLGFLVVRRAISEGRITRRQEDGFSILAVAEPIDWTTT